MPVDPQRIIQEHGFLRDQQQVWRLDWQDLADVAMPAQSDIISFRKPGTRRTEHIFDTTFALAVDNFAGHIYSGTTNFAMQWFGLTMRALSDSKRANQWFEGVAEELYLEMVADDSQVPQSIYESLRHYALFGTGAHFLDEQPMGVIPSDGFRGYQSFAPSIGTYYPQENASGRVDTMYRDIELTPLQAEQWFGREQLSKVVQDVLEDNTSSNKWYTPAPYIHAVKPRREFQSGVDDALNMRWESVYIDVNNKHVVDESGFQWFPYQVFRWQKLIPHSAYGFGRGHLALPESKTLNIIDMDMLRALPRTMTPPVYLIGAGNDAAGKVSLLPGAQNPLAAGSSVVPYAGGERFDVATLQVAERQGRIREAFFLDQLAFLPDVRQRTQRTLGELVLRQREMARIMGPAFVRLLSEMLNPFIDVAFALKLHARSLPPPPPEVIEAAMVAQGTIDVQYTGPLAMAQRDTDAEAILEGVEFLTTVMIQTGDRTVLANVDMDDSIARFLEVRGFPKSLITDRRLMQEIRAQAIQQAQQQAQLEQGAQMPKAAGDAAPAVAAVGELAAQGA